MLRFRTVSTRAREAEWELGTLATDNIVRHSRRAEITTLHEVSWMRFRVSHLIVRPIRFGLLILLLQVLPRIKTQTDFV